MIVHAFNMDRGRGQSKIVSLGASPVQMENAHVTGDRSSHTALMLPQC
jgi:hypothetical protein